MLSKWVHRAVELYENEDGPTAVEYAVLLSLIIIACLSAITSLGSNANSTFKTVGSKLGSASS